VVASEAYKRELEGLKNDDSRSENVAPALTAQIQSLEMEIERLMQQEIELIEDNTQMANELLSLRQTPATDILTTPTTTAVTPEAKAEIAMLK